MSKFGNRPFMRDAVVGVRSVARTFGTTRIHTTINDEMVVLDSEVERIAATIFAVDPTVLKASSQPFSVDLIAGKVLRTADEVKAAKVMYRDVGGECIYTPDFEVITDEGRFIAIEVKDVKFPGSDEYLKKLERAKDILLEFGYEFGVMQLRTDRHCPVRQNLKLLQQAKKLGYALPTEDELKKLTPELKTIGDVCTALGCTLSRVPALLLSGVMGMDLIKTPLRKDAEIWLNQGDLGELCVMKGLLK